MRCMEGFKYVNISNGLFLFEWCSLKTATWCANKFTLRELLYLYAHTVAVMRLHLSKKNNPLLKYHLNLLCKAEIGVSSLKLRYCLYSSFILNTLKIKQEIRRKEWFHKSYDKMKETVLFCIVMLLKKQQKISFSVIILPF